MNNWQIVFCAVGIGTVVIFFVITLKFTQDYFDELLTALKDIASNTAKDEEGE